MLEQILFYVLSALIVGAAVSVITLKNLIYSALSFLVMVLTLAVLYLLMQSAFLAAIQVVVYAGAIAVIFIFTIMLIGVGREEQAEAKPLYLFFAVLAVGGLVTLLTIPLYLKLPKTFNTATTEASVTKLGHLLFQSYLLPFELLGLLMLTALIGIVLLSQKREA